MLNPKYFARLGDETWFRTLVDDIFAHGYIILPEFLTPEFFYEVTAIGEAEGSANARMDVTSKTRAYDLAVSPEFMALFNGLHKARCEKEAKPCLPLRADRQRVGFPYKDARDGKKSEETEYHYDGAYVNATLAIKMPEKGGELIAFPNIRPNPGSFAARAYSRLLRHLPFLRRLVYHVIAKSKPNDLCLFFGDRTFHGVEPIASGERLIMTINNHW